MSEQPATLVPPEPILHHSVQSTKQSKAIINSNTSEQAVEEACTTGEAWATDSANVNYILLAESERLPELSDEDDDKDAIPVLHTTTINHTPPPRT